MANAAKTTSLKRRRESYKGVALSLQRRRSAEATATCFRCKKLYAPRADQHPKFSLCLTCEAKRKRPNKREVWE
jgi:hypothetical protein